HLAEVIDGFTDALSLKRYSLYLQDYGGPVGFRLALAHPERVEAIIVQNAVAHEDSLGPLWNTRRAFWADRNAHEAALRENFLSLAATRQRVVGSNPRPRAVDPDYWRTCLPFSAVRDRPTSKSSCSTTTAPTSRAIRYGRLGSAGCGRCFSLHGDATTRRSWSPRPRHIAATCPVLRCMCWMRGTSPS